MDAAQLKASAVREDAKVHEASALQNFAGLISQEYIQLWTKTAYEIFLAMISDRKEENEVLCVPQLIAVLAFLAEVTDMQCRQTIRERILPKGLTTLGTIDTAIADYLRLWEHSTQLSAKPGSFNSNRRVLVHNDHTKSYEYDTFMSLKVYGFDVKIAFNDVQREVASWIRRTLKIESMPDTNPFRLWPVDEKDDPQTISNQKCPILWTGSHFAFPFHTNMLDSDKVYSINFKNPEGYESEVYACRIHSGESQPFRNLTLSGGSIIVLPSICDHLSVYLITNIDNSQVKDGKLCDLIRRIRTTKEDNPQKITTIYLPLFADIPRQSTNLALAINRAIESIDKLFQPDGFGKLGCPGSEASPVVGRRQTTNIQSFDYLELMHLPDIIEPIAVRSGDNKVFMINQAFQLIVYDNERDIPLYLARIASPDRVRTQSELLEKDVDKMKAAPTTSQRFLSPANIISKFSRKHRSPGQHHE